MSVRERRKLVRRRQIDDAARTIFREKGYEAATTREIAARAGIGAGTLFAYARDKGTLLRRVVATELAEVTRESVGTLPAGAPLLDRLVHLFAPRFAFWGADPRLARHAMREFFSQQYAESGIPPEERPELGLLDALVALAAEAQRDGTLARAEEPAMIARLLLDVYLNENRDWILGDQPDIAAGVARLRAVLALALRGIAPPGRAQPLDDALAVLLDAARGLDADTLGELARYAAFRRSQAAARVTTARPD